MEYRYWDAKELLWSSVAPDSLAEAAAYRAGVIKMFADAGIRIECTELDDAQLAADPGRWILVFCDEVDAYEIHLIMVTGDVLGRWRDDLARATYYGPSESADTAAVWFANLRIASTLGYHITESDLDSWADKPGCPSFESFASDPGAFRGCPGATVPKPGVVTGNLLDARILGVTRFIVYQ